MRKHIVALTLLYCCIALPAFGVDGVSLDPSATLYTARQLGMGGVSVAFANDANGVLANPACLTKLEFPQMTGSSRKLVLDETQYTLFGWAIPSDWGTFGVGYAGISTGGSLPTKLDPATNRIIIDPSREATSYNNSVIALSYSREFFDWLSLGLNLKSFSQVLSGDMSSTASGMGYDFGVLVEPMSWAKFGANLQNISEATLAWDGGANDTVGGYYKLGCKLNLLGSSQEALKEHGQALAVGIDYDLPHSTLSAAQYHLGLEYFPLEKLALRTGFSADGITFGLGVVNGGFRFDYAYVARPEMPGDTPHYFTLSYIGERVIKYDRKLKQKEHAFNFLNPKDRSVTDKASIVMLAEAKAKRIIDQTKRWVVTAVSETKEVTQVTEFENLGHVSYNGKIIGDGKPGTVETTVKLHPGRNVIKFNGHIMPEGIMGTGEAKILRFAPFEDTPMTHWAIKPIALSSTLGLVKGYKNNLFKPSKGISRAELVTLLVRTFPVKTEDLIASADFKDLPSSHWAAKYVAFGVEKKLVTGYPNGTFKPNKVLSRAEGITILARYAGLKEDANAGAEFPDLKDDFWANKYVAPAKKAGLLEYLKGRDLKPSAAFTRAEACEVLYHTPIVQKKVDDYWERGIVGGAQ